MPQLTLRVTDELADDLREEAARRGKSLNAWAGDVLRAAVDPDMAGSEADRLRERLRRAGLLAEPPLRVVERPDPDLLARAEEAAGRGRPLAEFVSEGRD